jgi:hypothetical protein
LGRADDKVLLKGALDMRKGHGAAVKAHVQAMVVLPFRAKGADLTGPGGGYGHQLALLQIAGVCSERANYARDLMAQYHRLAQFDRSKPTIMIIVEIRPADAARLHLDQHLTSARGGHLLWFNAQVTRGMDDD